MSYQIKPKILLVATLFLLVIILLLWVRAAYYQWYDPDLSLPPEISDALYEPDSMVLYLDLDCPCNLLSAAHLNNLRSQFKVGVSQYIWLDSNQWSEDVATSMASQFSIEPSHVIQAPVYWQGIVEKTPTVLLFNQDATLGYFGPVSSGLSCNYSTSFIDQLLENIAAKLKVNGLINSQVKGCFCDRE